MVTRDDITVAAGKLYLTDDDSLHTVERGGVERVEHEVRRRVHGQRAVEPLVGDEAAELERVWLAQLPVERLRPRLLHEELLQLRCAPRCWNPSIATTRAASVSGYKQTGRWECAVRADRTLGGGGDGSVGTLRFGLGEAEVAARASERQVGVGAAALLRRERGRGGGEGGGRSGTARPEALGGAREEVGDCFGCRRGGRGRRHWLRIWRNFGRRRRGGVWPVATALARFGFGGRLVRVAVEMK